MLAGRRDERRASVESVEREDYIIDRHDASRTTIWKLEVSQTRTRTALSIFLPQTCPALASGNHGSGGGRAHKQIGDSRVPAHQRRAVETFEEFV